MPSRQQHSAQSSKYAMWVYAVTEAGIWAAHQGTGCRAAVAGIALAGDRFQHAHAGRASCGFLPGGPLWCGAADTAHAWHGAHMHGVSMHAPAQRHTQSHAHGAHAHTNNGAQGGHAHTFICTHDQTSAHTRAQIYRQRVPSAVNNDR